MDKSKSFKTKENFLTTSYHPFFIDRLKTEEDFPEIWEDINVSIPHR
jgi:hypothetical protein